MATSCTHTDERPVNVAGAADRLGVGERMVRKLVATRKIKFIKVGALVRFRPCDLDEFLDAATVLPGGGTKKAQTTAKTALSRLDRR